MSDQDIGRLEGKLDGIATTLERLEGVISKDHDDLTGLKSSHALFQKIVWIVLTPVLGSIGMLLWSKFIRP